MRRRNWLILGLLLLLFVGGGTLYLMARSSVEGSFSEWVESRAKNISRRLFGWPRPDFFLVDMDGGERIVVICNEPMDASGP